MDSKAMSICDNFPFQAIFGWAKFSKNGACGWPDRPCRQRFQVKTSQWAQKSKECCLATVDGRNPANQKRLVVNPMIYKVFLHLRWLFGISETSTVCSWEIFPGSALVMVAWDFSDTSPTLRNTVGRSHCLSNHPGMNHSPLTSLHMAPCWQPLYGSLVLQGWENNSGAHQKYNIYQSFGYRTSDLPPPQKMDENHILRIKRTSKSLKALRVPRSKKEAAQMRKRPRTPHVLGGCFFFLTWVERTNE